MPKPFFPDPVFAWLFYAILVGLLLVATVRDFRTFVVPKAITITCLALGVAFNVARGAWLGTQDGGSVWLLGESPGLWLGALDGLLFSLFGFLVAFAAFFVLWVLGACGGGDVKLFAALGAWVGAWYAVFILVAANIILVCLAVVLIGGRALAMGQKPALYSLSEQKARAERAARKGRKPRSRLMTYSFPLAVATSLLLLWFFRFDLQLAARPHAPAEVSQNAGPGN
jgi:prepilin peptidase CpaA